jgi:hypothetical protein
VHRPKPFPRSWDYLAVKHGHWSRDENVGRYVAVVLLLVPWVLLEQINPIAFLLFARKHHLAATQLIIAAESSGPPCSSSFST